jgi:hypothetical protein
MKIFVLKPSDSWEFAAGGFVVVARDLARAEELAVAEEKRRYQFTDPGRPKFFASQAEADEADSAVLSDFANFDAWVLVEELEVEGTQIERVVLCDYTDG